MNTVAQKEHPRLSKEETMRKTLTFVLPLLSREFDP